MGDLIHCLKAEWTQKLTLQEDALALRLWSRLNGECVL